MSRPNRLRVDLKPSAGFAAALIAAHLLAGSAALPLSIPGWVRLVLVAAIALSAVASIRRHALRTSPRACIALEVHRDGSVRWQLRSGATLDGQLLGDTLVTPLLTLVSLRRADNGRREAVVLTPGSAERDALRALRVWLRFKVEVQ